jgi:hypothetical protein
MAKENVLKREKHLLFSVENIIFFNLMLCYFVE